jgi:hypothetical protein
MIDPEKLALLRPHAVKGDWSTAACIYEELSTAAKGTSVEFLVEELTLALQLKDARRLALIIDDLTLPD